MLPSGPRGVLNVHNGVEGSLGGGLIGLLDLVEDVADPVRLAALDWDVRIDSGQGGEETLAAVDADHPKALAFETAAAKVLEEQLPPGGALVSGQAVVDEFLSDVQTRP